MAENKYHGLYKGKVSNIDDKEKRGRIRVQCPEVLGEDVESAWCDPCVNVAYEEHGDIWIPKVGDTVWVSFIEGDANRPIWMGSWWSEEKTPFKGEYDDKKKKERIIDYEDIQIIMNKEDDEQLIIKDKENTKITFFKDKRIEIDAGDGACDVEIKDKKVTIFGDLRVEGKITAKGDVIAEDRVSLAHHVHDCPHGGKTSEPN